MQSQTYSNQPTHTQNDGLLRRVLQSNALFSLLSSLLFIFAAGPLARYLGSDIPAWLLVVIGFSLLPFAAGVYWVVSNLEVRWSYGRIITILDFSWVVLSYLVLAVGWAHFSVAGRWFVALQAELIFLFGVLQIIGLRRLHK